MTSFVVDNKAVYHVRCVDVINEKVVPEELNSTCKSLILSSNEPRQSSSPGNTVYVVRGFEARNLLGGLQQYFRGFDTDI